MDVPDGGIASTPNMFGKPVYEQIDGEVRLSHICDLRYLGLRRVLKPDLGNRMFFAGRTPRATIATHNANYKP
jgi:hypothetical protein